MSKMLKNSSSKRSFDPRELRSELRSEVSSDHLVVRATGWTMRHQRIIEMELEWQRLEAALFTKAATREISCAAAMKGKFAEAKRMRALDAEIGVGYRELAFEAGEIQAMKSSSVAAALAKVELGLRVQGPYDWRDHARQLIDEGIGELKSMLEDVDLA